MATLADLANKDMLPLALSWCNGLSLASMRSSARDMTEVVSESSPLWDSLLCCYTALLQHPKIPGADASNAAMLKSIRLGHAVDRCDLKLGRDSTISAAGYGPITQQRHSLIVTGARRSGISSLVRMLVKGVPAGGSSYPLPPAQDMMVHTFRAQLGGRGVMARVVDKRITAISTPLSASLYKGPTSCFFVFDAERMEETLTEVAWCIEELRQTVGPEKFSRIPKLLVCHKADLLPLPSAGQQASEALLRVASLPPMCKDMLTLYQMDLVLTSTEDQSSVDLAFALAAEQWPKHEREVDHDVFPPVGSTVSPHRASLRPTRTRISSHPVVSPAIQPGSRPQNLFEELQIRVTRQE